MRREIIVDYTAMPFEQIGEGDHVISIEEENVVVANGFNDRALVTTRLCTILNEFLRVSTGSQWLKQGVKAKFLKLGSSRWITGKIRFKVVIEFCPDDPSATSELEEFRQ